MSFRGRGSDQGRGSRSFSRGGGAFSRGNNSRGGRGGFRAMQPSGPPDQIQEMGYFAHACEGDLVCQSSNVKIPYFNAPIYLENKSIVGKVDEILGPVNQVYFTVKPQEGVVASSFKEGDKFYIGADKLLPLDKFLPKPKQASGPSSRRSGSKPVRSGRGGRGVAGGRGARGGRGGGRGGFGGRGPASSFRGASRSTRGGSRGGFSRPFRGGRG